jgi:ankyrin repeat protein
LSSICIQIKLSNTLLDIVNYIIEQLSTLEQAKTLINTKNNEGNTPLHWAALNGHLEVVEALVKNGGDCKVIFFLIEKMRYTNKKSFFFFFFPHLDQK